MQRPDLGLVLGLGLPIGLVDGVITAFLGVPMPVEFAYWCLASVLAVWLLLRRAAPAPFLSLVLVYFIAGIAVGTVQWVFADKYVANYPTIPAVPGWQYLAFGVAIGIVWGALVGGIAWAIARKRAAPTPA